MLSRAIKIIILLILVGLVGWIGLSVYSCYDRQNNTGQSGLPDMPKEEDATHSVYIENSGNLLLTSNYEVHGVTPGSRIFVLHTFWELSGQKFVYKNTDVILDEGIFGQITIKRR